VDRCRKEIAPLLGVATFPGAAAAEDDEEGDGMDVDVDGDGEEGKGKGKGWRRRRGQKEGQRAKLFSAKDAVRGVVCVREREIRE
jgi:hypothetical protein